MYSHDDLIIASLQVRIMYICYPICIIPEPNQSASGSVQLYVYLHAVDSKCIVATRTVLVRF